MKYHAFIILLFFVQNIFGQSKILPKFDIETHSFQGTKFEQATCLLRTVNPMGIIDRKDARIPEFLEQILKDSIQIISKEDLKNYLTKESIEAQEIGGDLDLGISKNKKGISAKYFVIHDVSTPNYLDNDFPPNINDDTWDYNNVKKNWNLPKAHVFVGRTGKSISPISLETAWRATKFELKVLDPLISKGLFLHIELVQPRKSDRRRWANNDVIAPIPGFTTEQYKRLALLYLVASIRKQDWLIPTYHSVLDQGLKNAHDDPQNFSLEDFGAAIEEVYAKISKKPIPIDTLVLDTIIQQPRWDSLVFDRKLGVDSSGKFLYKGYGNIEKIGNLFPHDFAQLNRLIDQISIKGLDYQGYIPADGKNHQTWIYHSQGITKISLANSNDPENLTQLTKFLSNLADSLSQSILNIDNQWIDVEKTKCLFWYNQQITPWQELPFGYIQWGGKQYHKTYVLARRESLSDLGLDYVIYVDEAQPGTSWNNARGKLVSHPITRKKKMRKRELKKALKAYSK